MNGFLLISLLFTLRSETPHVTIEDFGGKADGITCNGPALMKAFAHAKEYPGTTLRLGGVCRVTTPQTMHFANSMAAGATGVTNLTIQGGEIILGGDFGAFSFTDCPGLTLRDVVFDYDPPIHSQGDILSSVKTNRTMVVLPDSGYPSPADTNLFSNRETTWLTVHHPEGEFIMSLRYNKSGTIDSWYNDVQIHTNELISSSTNPAIKYATVGFRGLIFEDGANIDALMVEAIHADVIYSNDFNGTEFKATGVGASAYNLAQISAGRLVPTTNSANLSGFRVDLTALGLATDPNVTAVQVTITGKAPLTVDGANYLGLAFQGSDSYNVNTFGNPIMSINGTGLLNAGGGAGYANNYVGGVSQGANFTSGGEFTMSLRYNKSGTIDTWYNGVQVHSNQAIDPSTSPTLKYAVVAFRNLSFPNGANIDTLMVEAIHEPEVIYFNDFNGTEFKVPGVGNFEYNLAAISDGRLAPTTDSLNLSGCRVDLTALGLATNPTVTAVQITIFGKAPLIADGANYLGLAFQDSSSYNVNTWGNPVIGIEGNGYLKASGGAGFATNYLPKVDLESNFTSGSEYGFFFVGHVDSAVEGTNGQAILTYNRADLAETLEGTEKWRYVRVRRGLGQLNVFTFCDDLRIEGCSFHAASGFVGLFVYCNDVVLTDNRICLRKNSRHMVSSCADGFHFMGGRTGPLIENNFFDRLQDDNIVISLRGNKIKSVNGDQLELENASVAWYHAGDTIEVVEVETGTRREYTIVDMQPQIYHWAPPVMTLDRPLEGNIVLSDVNQPETLPTLVFNKSWRLDGTVIRSNVFQNTRRYAVFMGAGGVRIENNVMSNHTSSAILCSYIGTLKNQPNDLIYYFSSDILIRSNTLVNALNYGEGGRVFSRSLGAIDVNDRDRIVTGIGSLRLLRNISIQDNRIVNSGSAGIRMANASAVTLSGNTIVDPNRQIQSNYYGISIEASDVTLSNNVFSGSNIVEEVHQVP